MNSDNKYLIDVKELMPFVEGKGLDIINALIPSLRSAVDVSQKSTHVDCPFPNRHKVSGGKKKFRLWKSRSPDYKGAALCTCGRWSSVFDLLTDVNGLTFFEALEQVNEYLGDPLMVKDKLRNRNANLSEEDKRKREMEIAAKQRAREEEAQKAREEREKKLEKQDQFFIKLLSETWKKSLPVTHHSARPLWLYLKNRGIRPEIIRNMDDIRFHPELEFHMGGELLGTYPGMLCLYRDASGRAITIHRTFLTHEGEKAVLPGDEDAKRVMPAPSFVDYNGGAIRLMKHKSVLGVAEGIETAMSVYFATGIPTWPTYCADMLETFSIPDEVELLLIWADKDLSLKGESSSRALKQRAWDQGKHCQILLPKHPIQDGKKSMDWNDVLINFGRTAFPKINPEEIWRRKTA